MLRRGWRVTLSTDARGARYAGGFPDRDGAAGGLGHLRAGRRGWPRLAVPFRIAAGIASTAHAMYRDRPAWWWASAAIPAIPALAAAWLTRPRA
jgi:UDP-N-acetylglucosamine--N-acetylmuramyl-(pentapeptide) pyrophosphoryl-undecaprenol N-acetylglucosamine transferase